MDKVNFSNYLEQKAKKEGIQCIVVGALILNSQRKMLILKRKPDDFLGGYYEIPGGHVEEGENIFKAVERETIEETNLAISKIGSYLGHFDYIDSDNIRCRQFNFSVSVEMTTKIKLTEHVHYKWIDESMIEDINKISDEVKDILITFSFNNFIE